MNTTLEVRKDHLSESRLVTREDAALADGQVRVRVERFALTSNNITYAAFGDAMNYWQFFPTQEPGWGIVPVWGFATVVQSLHPAVAVGERLYGYWPMAGSAVLTPDRVTSEGFSDGAPHRKELHPVYNRYLRVNADPFYTADSEDAQALLRPLFTTSWLIDDFLADNGFFGADTVLLSSASSKTAYGTAMQLAQRPGIRVVGLTSAGNRAFCESLGCYHQVLAYDELEQLPADTACVYTDFAGNVELRRRIHTRFANLRYSCAIGGTHVEQLGGAKDLPGPRATLFFAPAQIKKRNADWGPQGLGERLVASWQAFRDRATQGEHPWLQVRHHRGPEAAQAAYAQVLGGRGDPRLGHMLSM
jgi:NADPH:quinone reductase-like Zn-dependent oxidoreductase